MNFYETKMGQQFFTRQLPQLIRALEDIAKAESKPIPMIQLPGTDAGDILSDLYNVKYTPECYLCKENDPLRQDLCRTTKSLLRALSPEQQELFFQYEAVQNTYGNSISERAYKDGVRLAVQVMMAGYRPSTEEEPCDG